MGHLGKDSQKRESESENGPYRPTGPKKAVAGAQRPDRPENGPLRKARQQY